MVFMGVDAHVATGSAAPEWAITVRHCASAGTVRARAVATPLNRVDDVHGGYVSYRTRTGDGHHTILFGCVDQDPVRVIALTPWPASGRVNLARQLLDMLPHDLASINEPEHRATEYLHYRQFFNVWELIDKVVQCQSLQVSLVNKDARATWLSNYRVCRRPNQLAPPMLNVAPPGSHRSNLQRRRKTSHF